MRRILMLLMAVSLPLTACGDDDDPSGPTIEASGTYSLSTVNGEQLPVTVARLGADSLQILDGRIELNTDNTFSDSSTYRLAEGGEVTTEADVVTGTYSQSRNTLTLYPLEGAAYSLAVSEDALTQTFGQFVLVYRK